MKNFSIIPFSWLSIWCFSLFLIFATQHIFPQCTDGFSWSETPQTGSCHQPSPRTKQSVHTSSPPHSLVGQAWHPALRRWRTSQGQRREGTQMKILRKRAPNTCSWWRDERKMEDEFVKAYLISDAQHTAGAGERQVMAAGSTCLFVWVVAPVCLSSFVPAGSMSCIFCLGRGCLPCLSPFLRHSSSSSLTWKHSATQQLQSNKTTELTVAYTGSSTQHPNRERAKRNPWPGSGRESLTYPFQSQHALARGWAEKQTQRGWTSAMPLM